MCVCRTHHERHSPSRVLNTNVPAPNESLTGWLCAEWYDTETSWADGYSSRRCPCTVKWAWTKAGSVEFGWARISTTCESSTSTSDG